MRETIEIPDETQVVAAGFPLSLSGRVEIEFAWVDFGIGAYECHGARGVQVSMGAEDANIVFLDLEDKLPEAVAEATVIAALNKKLDDDDKFQDTIYERIGDAMADDGF